MPLYRLYTKIIALLTHANMSISGDAYLALIGLECQSKLAIDSKTVKIMLPFISLR